MYKQTKDNGRRGSGEGNSNQNSETTIPPARIKPHSIPVDILDELAARFIINVREDERNNLVRLCFQVELAHWFYIDYYVSQYPEKKLQAGTIREFALHMFRHVPFLQKDAYRVDEIVDTWREYKLAVPTYGAIIMNKVLDKALLVQGFWTKASWGFPKGKVNQEEPPQNCAAREVYEETGFDISSRIDENLYLEEKINGQFVRLYLISGVPESTEFSPKSRCEIKDIRWFTINSLPQNSSDLTSKAKNGYTASSFYMVIPFLRGLKAWVKMKQCERYQLEMQGGPLQQPQLQQQPQQQQQPRSRLKSEGGGGDTRRSKTPRERTTPNINKHGQRSRKNSQHVAANNITSTTTTTNHNGHNNHTGHNNNHNNNGHVASNGTGHHHGNNNAEHVVDQGQHHNGTNGQPTLLELLLPPRNRGDADVNERVFRPVERPGDPRGHANSQANRSRTERQVSQIHRPLLVPPSFCPTSWSNFRINEDECMSVGIKAIYEALNLGPA